MRLSLFFSSLFCFASAFPFPSTYSLHEKRSHIPHGWSRSHKFHPSSVLPLRFALSQSNIDDIGQYLNDVSHPQSPNYGNHWTPGKIASTFAPAPETINAIRNWLLENGFTGDRIRLTKAKGWIEVNATVEEAENLLLTQYHVYKHESGQEHVGAFLLHLGRVLVFTLSSL
jgi:tripeptidyl-peptidase I